MAYDLSSFDLSSNPSTYGETFPASYADDNYNSSASFSSPDFSYLDQRSQDLFAGGLLVGDVFGQDWTSPTSLGWLASLDTPPQSQQQQSDGLLAAMNSMFAPVKDAGSDFWTTINKESNRTGVNLASNFLAGMLMAPLRNRQIKAQERASEAAMINAQVNVDAQKLNEKKLENASSIKNTTFGAAPATEYTDLLAERRKRNTGLIGTQL